MKTAELEKHIEQTTAALAKHPGRVSGSAGDLLALRRRHAGIARRDGAPACTSAPDEPRLPHPDRAGRHHGRRRRHAGGGLRASARTRRGWRRPRRCCCFTPARYWVPSRWRSAAIIHARIGIAAAFGFVIAASLFAGDLTLRQYAGHGLFPMDARVKPGHDGRKRHATSLRIGSHPDVAAGRGDLAVRFLLARVRRPETLQPHELCGRGRDRHRRQVGDRDARLVPDRSRRLPRGAAGRADRRPHPAECARARRLRRLADPAERQRHAVHRAGQFRHRRRPPVPRQPDARALHPDHADADRRRQPGRLSRRGFRI